MTINPKNLKNELKAANIQISGCNSDGVVWGEDFDENGCSIEIQDRDDVKAIINSHDPTPDYDSVLRKEYNKAGINSTDMIFALWKKVMSADSVDADALQVKIDQVNLSINP